MTNKWQRSFSYAALLMRPLTVFFALLIGLATFWLIDCNRYSTILTAFEAALGIVGVWLTLEIFRVGDSLSQQQSQVVEAQGKLIDEIHRTIMVSMFFQHSQELRRKYEDAKKSGDSELLGYWHFAWRFETYEVLTVNLKPTGWAKIKILGVNNPALETNFEKLDIPIYTVEIIEGELGSDLKIGRAYCWCLRGKSRISNSANEVELYEPTVEFEIAGLGDRGVRKVRTSPKNYLRLKDLRSPF